MTPAKADEHPRKRAVVARHAETIEQGRSLHGVAQKKASDKSIGFIDNPFRQGMVIIADRTDLAIREPEILPLQGIGSADGSPVEGHEILVEYGFSVGGKPAWLGTLVEHQVLACAARLKPAIKLHYRGLVLAAIGLDDD